MKKLLLLLIIPLINFGQTKKQRIEILKFQKDSLKNILTQERIKINTLEGSIDSLLEIEKENIARLIDYKEGLVFANNNIDSLRNTLSQERLKINNLKHSTDSLLKIEKEYSIALNNCETALEFANNTIDSLKIDFKKELEQTQWELDKAESQIIHFQLEETSWKKKNRLLQNKLDSVKLTVNSSKSIPVNSNAQYFSTTKSKKNNYNYYSSIDYESNWGEGAGYYIIGWSNDGLLAYIREDTGSGMFWCYSEIIIMDLKTDKIIDNLELESLSEDDEDFDYNNDNNCVLQFIWEKKYRSINAFLKKHNIKDGTVQKINLENTVTTRSVKTTKTSSFKINLTSNTIFDNIDDCEMDEKSQLKLKVTHNNKSKIVSRDVVVGNVSYLGYFTSTFEDRVCIVLRYANDGCGEYDHDSGLYFYGCSLNSNTFE